VLACGQPKETLLLARNVVMTGFPTTDVRTSKSYSMDHDARIKAATDDLESRNHPNVTATATEWKIAHETLSKRFRNHCYETVGIVDK
jgi:hypothetical protein